MLSQVSYLGCICDPDPATRSRIKSLIHEFIKGRLNIAKDKICTESKFGGLGMIDLDDFLVCIKCSWLKRLHNGNTDTYKEILAQLGCNILNFCNPEAINAASWPVLSNIWKAVCFFYKKFLSINNNWQVSPVVYNPLLVTGRGGGQFTSRFFAHNTPPISIENAIAIKVADIWHNGRLKSLDEINDVAPVQVSLVTYMRIAETVRFWDKKNMVPVDNATGTSLVQFLSKFKKGSKQFRNILNQHKVSASIKIGCKSLNNLMAALTIPVEYGAPVPVPVPGRLAESTIFKNKILECWNLKFLSNRHRDFLYKYVSNRLSLNNRLAHFNDQVNAGCTFCTLEGRRPVPVETAGHLFFDCPSTNNLLARADSEFWPEFNLNPEKRKSLWLGLITCFLNDTGSCNIFVQITVGTVQFFVWECKIKKQKPSWATCSDFTVELLKYMCLTNNFFHGEKTKSNCALSRRW
jgi:hypothetical protein